MTYMHSTNACLVFSKIILKFSLKLTSYWNIQMFRYVLKESAKLRALCRKTVLAYQHALRAYVLTCQPALCV